MDLWPGLYRDFQADWGYRDLCLQKTKNKKRQLNKQQQEKTIKHSFIHESVGLLGRSYVCQCMESQLGQLDSAAYDLSPSSKLDCPFLSCNGELKKKKKKQKHSKISQHLQVQN